MAAPTVSGGCQSPDYKSNRCEGRRKWSLASTSPLSYGSGKDFYKSIGAGEIIVRRSLPLHYSDSSSHSIDLKRGAFFPPPTRQSQDIGIPYSPVKRLVSGWLVLTNERLGSRPFDQSEGSILRQPASVCLNNS